MSRKPYEGKKIVKQKFRGTLLTNIKKVVGVVLVIAFSFSTLFHKVYAEYDHMDKRKKCTMTIEAYVHTGDSPAQATGVCEGLVKGFYVPEVDLFTVIGAVTADITKNGQVLLVPHPMEDYNPALTVYIVKKAPPEKPKEEKPKEEKPKEEGLKEEEPKDVKPKEEKPKEEKPKDVKPKEEKSKEAKPKEQKPEQSKSTKPKEVKPQNPAPKKETSISKKPSTTAVAKEETNSSTTDNSISSDHTETSDEIVSENQDSGTQSKDRFEKSDETDTKRDEKLEGKQLSEQTEQDEDSTKSSSFLPVMIASFLLLGLLASGYYWWFKRR